MEGQGLGVELQPRLVHQREGAVVMVYMQQQVVLGIEVSVGVVLKVSYHCWRGSGSSLDSSIHSWC